MVISQDDVWWADLPDPIGSGPGFRRPVVVVQGDPLNRSRIAAVVCVPLTSNLKWADAPGNVRLAARRLRRRAAKGKVFSAVVALASRTGSPIAQGDGGADMDTEMALPNWLRPRFDSPFRSPAAIAAEFAAG